MTNDVDDLYRKRPKLNLRPPYQRKDKWSPDMNHKFIDSLMTNGLVAPLTFYEIQPEDNYTHTEFTDEVVDGQHRLRCIFAFMDSTYFKSPRKKQYIVHWLFAQDDGPPVHVFYKQTDDVVDWCHKQKYEPVYLDEQLKRDFGRICINISRIDSFISMDGRRKLFVFAQYGVQAKNSDVLKNRTDCLLIDYMSIHGYEERMESETGILAFCHRKTTQYYCQWTCRLYFIYHEVIIGQKKGKIDIDKSAAHFVRKDTDYKNRITGKDELLMDTTMFDGFHEKIVEFQEELLPICKDENNKPLQFTPTQFFALFYHLCTGPPKIESYQIRVYYNRGKDQTQRKMWETTDRSVRMDYFKECVLYLQDELPLIPSDIFTVKIKPKTKKAVWENKFGSVNEGICRCGVVMTKDKHHCSHIIPRSHGGRTDVSNLTPRCKRCNLQMGTRNLHEYDKNVHDN